VQGNAASRAASGEPVCIPAPDAVDLEGGADRLLADGEMLDLSAGLSFTVFATPGHSPGMACLYEPERKLLIVSDAVEGYGPPGAGLPLGNARQGSNCQMSARLSTAGTSTCSITV
jgi:glyoxylase-like metal-dependent hydrolase (beta-lactamase superfamily II)